MTAWGRTGAGRLPAPPRRDVVDHALARRAQLQALHGAGTGRAGATGRDDVCDAPRELVDAAQERGTTTDRPCPVCGRDLLREVVWVFGDALGCLSGTARTPVQLAALAVRRAEFAVHEVEVCPACRWHALLRSWRTGQVQQRRV